MSRVKVQAVNVLERPEQWDSAFDANMLAEDVERLLRVPPFRDMDTSRFPPNKSLFDILMNESRLRQFKPGELICRQGDYGSSAFLLLAGEVVSVGDLPQKTLGHQEARKASLFQTLARVLRNPVLPEVRDTSVYGQSQDLAYLISQDAQVVKDMDKLMSAGKREHLKPGDFFAEVTVISRSTHQTSVVATQRSEALEIKWQGFRELMNFCPEFKQAIQDKYRKQGIVSHIAGFEAFAGQDPAVVREVGRQSELMSFGSFDWFREFKKSKEDGQLLGAAREPVIVSEGDYADAVYLVRAGFVRVGKKQGKEFHTSHYLHAGDIYGLDELDAGRDSAASTAYAYTLKAIGYADVIRVPVSVAANVLPAGWKARGGSASLAWAGEGGPTQALKSFLIDHRFINGTKTMLINLDRCVGCDDCVTACSRIHDNNPRFIRHGETFDRFMVANACMHCHDPVCLIGCPTGAIHRRPGKGQVVINDQTCVGCMTCANSCPYNNIRMVNIRDEEGNLLLDEQHRPIVKATKCDLCADQMVSPSCQQACPHDALRRVDVRELDRIKDWLGS